MTAALEYFALLISIYENQVESCLCDFVALYQSYRDEQEQFKELQSAMAVSLERENKGASSLASFDMSDFYLEVFYSLEKKKKSLSLAQGQFYPIAESLSRLLEDYKKFTMQGIVACR